MSFIGIGIRWFFVLLLAASAIGKLADMPGFYRVIKSYALLPEPVIPISAWALAISDSSFPFARSRPSQPASPSKTTVGGNSEFGQDRLRVRSQPGNGVHAGRVGSALAWR